MKTEEAKYKKEEMLRSEVNEDQLNDVLRDGRSASIVCVDEPTRS